MSTIPELALCEAADIRELGRFECTRPVTHECMFRARQPSDGRHDLVRRQFCALHTETLRSLEVCTWTSIAVALIGIRRL